MKKLLALILLLHSLSLSAQETSANTESCAHWMSFFKPVCQRLHQVWTQGDNELYLTGYSWHNRYTYRKEKIKTFNELAWGGGLGKGFFDEKGNWHGLYAMAFLDSHRHIQPAAGYAYLKVAQLGRDLKAGLGYAIVVTSRVDINHNIPFPGVLPWASIFFKRATLGATYIPGTRNNGNVLFLFAKYNFSG